MSKELIDLRKKDLDQLDQELAAVRAEQFTMTFRLLGLLGLFVC